MIADDKLSMVLVLDDTLVCPYCQANGLETFLYIEDVVNFRKLIRMDDGRLVIESESEVADEGDNSRLECAVCHKQCAIPPDLGCNFEERVIDG